MKVKSKTFKLGIALIIFFWSFVIIIALKNIDSTLWGVGVLVGIVLTIAASFYLYISSIDPVDDDVNVFYTAMETEISNTNIQPGDCLACYEQLGPSDTVRTGCDHRFHKKCYFTYNETNPRATNGVYFCPMCLKMVETHTIVCYTGSEKLKDEEMGKQGFMEEVSLD